MRSPLRRAAAALLACSLVLVVAGCVTVASPVRTPNSGSTADPRPSDDVATVAPAPSEAECIDGVLRIGAAEAGLTFAGSCESVFIEGTDLDVDLERADVASIVIRGDRIDLDAGRIASLDIQGQDNEADLEALDVLSVTGDRNDVDVDGPIGSVTIDGNDNEVDTQSVGTISDVGDRNRVTTD